jgi:2-succinyl-5-enolpyruvyl-6-hydroxy-3-cyclohexene-1-carboxylate synthase
LHEFLDADKLSDKIKQNLITNSSFPNECRIISEVISCLPNSSNLMISNSMPIRDFDYFTPLTGKNIVVHTNRGASGIDGIVSTALGIKKASGRPTLLLTGDLAFFYDISSLLTAKKYNIPLVVVLINNNGGGIFGMLPVSDYGLKFREYFISPHYLDFAPIIRGFKANYKLVKSWNDLKKYINEAFRRNVFTILEIKTDIKSSVNLRKKYFSEADKLISQRLNEN